jgi:tRNA nucleotidyltransferase (CCA-adding enzyme)
VEQAADEILRQLGAAGFSAYKVGGYVRDKLLGIPAGDIDIATSAAPEQVCAMFPKVVPTGIKHGTVTVICGGLHFEVTTFRRESGYSDYRHPDRVDFVDDLETDLARRDFTMNAMAMDLANHVIDPFGGRKDLKDHLIRAVGDPLRRFSEDPLRIMRGIRFAAKLGYDFDRPTRLAMEQKGSLLEYVSFERVRDELNKMIIGDSPLKALGWLSRQSMFPFSEWRSFFYSVLAHPNQEQIKAYVDASYRFAFLFAGEELSRVESFLRQWKFSGHLIQQIINLLKIAEQTVETKEEGKRLLLDYPVNTVCMGRSLRKWLYPVDDMVDESVFRCWNQEIVIRSRKELAISAADVFAVIQRKPGPWVGQAFQSLFQKVALGQLQNDPEELLKAVSEVIDRDEG